MLSNIVPVEMDVPRDRDGSFEPATVRKRQRRMDDADEMVISLSAKDLTAGELSAHLAEVHHASVPNETAPVCCTLIPERSLPPLET